MAVTIIKEKCTGCGQCVLSCQWDALSMDPTFLSVVTAGNCVDCMICLEYCPNQAIRGKD